MDILHQVDELRPSLEQIIPKLKENGISGKVLRHCDLKELKNVGVFVVVVNELQWIRGTNYRTIDCRYLI